MKKIMLVLSIFFTASLVYAAGDPIPGVDISLEQIPGGIIPTESACLKKGGKIIHKGGKKFCKLQRVSASGFGAVDHNGDVKVEGSNTSSMKNASVINGDVKVENSKEKNMKKPSSHQR